MKNGENLNKFDELVLITKNILSRESFSSLRGVAVDWNANTIVIYFYNGGPVSEELENDFRCIGTEVVSQYFDATIDEHIERVDEVHPLPQHSYWAYLKH